MLTSYVRLGLRPRSFIGPHDEREVSSFICCCGLRCDPTDRAHAVGTWWMPNHRTSMIGVPKNSATRHLRLLHRSPIIDSDARTLGRPGDPCTSILTRAAYPSITPGCIRTCLDAGQTDANVQQNIVVPHAAVLWEDAKYARRWNVAVGPRCNQWWRMMTPCQPPALMRRTCPR